MRITLRKAREELHPVSGLDFHSMSKVQEQKFPDMNYINSHILEYSNNGYIYTSFKILRGYAYLTVFTSTISYTVITC